MPLPSVFQGVQDCRLPTFKCSKRLPQASKATTLTCRPLQTLPQASKATTLCPCHLFFRGFKTAVCPPSNAPNASAGLQGNNSYTAIHALAICFSGGSRLPFARLQTLPTLPQASKATTLTATCPCHLKATLLTAIHALPSVFQGVQDCRLPAFKRSKRFRRLPRQQPSSQQLLQLHALAICFSGGSRLPFARLQMLQTPPQASKATTLTCRPLQTLPQASKATTLCPCHLFFRGFKTAVCPPSNAPNASAGLQGNNSYSYTATAIHALAICFSGGSRLPFARLQTLPTLPQASKATTLTATCPCHLKATTLTAIHALPSVFQGVQDCRLPAFKRSKRFRRLPRQQPPSQQLLQLHALAICFSGGSRLPFARLQMLQTPPQASKATTLTCRPLQTLPQASKATTLCPCHLFFRGFKTAVCPPSNAPNASAGLQGNNSYSYTATAIHALAICFSGGSRLPFAHLHMLQTSPFTCRPLQTLPQASKATTVCPCHLFFRGFKTAVCPPSNAPNASAGLQGNNSYSYTATAIHALAICFSGGSRLAFAPSNVPNASAGFQGNRPPSQVNNSYSYMPLPSVFQGVQDCRLPTFKCSKRLRRPPRQQLLPAGLSKPSRRPPRQQLSALAICFSGGSRLPFARLQMLQTPPQASKATTLTAIQLQLYMPLPSVFQGVQDCRLPAFKRSQRSRRPPRQQLLQLHALAISRQHFLQLYMLCHLFFRGFKTAVCPPSNAPNASAGFQGNSLQVNNSYSYMPLPSVFQGVLDCHLPAFKCSKRLRRPPRQQLLPAGLSKPSRRPPRQQLSALAICFSGGSRLPFAHLQMLQTPPQASKATTLTAIQLQLYMPLPSVFQGVQDCRLPAFKCSKRLRLPAGLSKPSRRPPRQQLSALAICFSGGSRLPFARLQMLQTPPQASKATTLTAIQLQLYIHALAICFSGGSRLPFARLQMLQTPPQASKATTLTCTPLQTLPQASKATTLCPCHLFFRGFKTAVCPPSNAPNASAGLQGNNSYSYTATAIHALAICFSGGSRLPFARLQTLPTLPQASKATTLTATCPCHLKATTLTAIHALPSVFQGVQDCRLPAFKRYKRFRRLPRQQPPSQQVLQLHALAICFSGGSRLPFARLQMLQTPPQASKATTLTAIQLQLYMPLPSVFQGVQDCRLPAFKRSQRSRRPPRQQLLQLHALAISRQQLLQLYMLCHLFFRGFKTAVCPPSNAPNASAGFQGNSLQVNNSYSYMPLPSVFQGVQDLPAFKCSKRLRRPPRQQLLPAGLSKPPQASKATTLCPCHLFFRGFKTAVCPPSNAPNASAGLQGNNSYSYTATAIHALPICFSRGSRLPFARLQTPPLTCRPLQTLPQASKATTVCP